MSDSGPRVLTVLRGPQLRAQEPALPAATPAPAAPASPPGADTMTIYGVPVSAVQHCCGRGCRHCRIFWHGKKP